MTDRKQALIELRDKVMAGEDPGFEAWVDVFFRSAFNAIEAFNGSLDAAKALHEAVLPGWVYNLAPGFCHVMPPHDNGDQEATSGFNDNPARAWLIAILEALIAQEDAV
jgi:hypothetical protein